tara:strand:+ start:1104 stop:1520 length:417 start_codon:yes stop_codon:yes gene_type:complete
MNRHFSTKIQACLQAKVDRFNSSNDKKITIEQLIKVYKRGEKAAETNWMPYKSTAQWAMARVNMFIRLSADKPVSDVYTFYDFDIYSNTNRTYEQAKASPFWQFSNGDFESARTDLLLHHITDKEANKIFFPSKIEEK